MEEDHFGRGTHFGGIEGVKPGLKVRISEHLTEMIRGNLLQYGQSIVNFDYKHKESGMIDVDLFPLLVDFYYKNLEHDPISLDMKQFLFQFTHMAADDTPVIYLRLPMIRKWAYMFQYAFTWLGIPFGGDMKVEANGVDALMTVSLKSTDHG